MNEIIEHVKKDRKATNSREIIVIENSAGKGHVDYVSSDKRKYLHISYFSAPRFNTKNNSFIEDYNPETKRVRSRYEFNNCYSWVP